QSRIRQRSFSVVVFNGLFFRSLSIVELEIWCLLINVYVDSFDFFNVSQNTDTSASLAAFGIMVLSIAVRIVTQYISQLQRTHAGYFMVADKRVQIGDKLKVVPMGYFNQNSLGNITAIATTILSDVENAAPVVLVTSLGGFLTSFVFCLAILIFD